MPSLVLIISLGEITIANFGTHELTKNRTRGQKEDTGTKNGKLGRKRGHFD